MTAMRARILVTISAVVAILGLIVVVCSVLWLAANSGFTEQAYDSENPLYGKFFFVRSGISGGIFTALVGLGIVLGFARKARKS